MSGALAIARRDLLGSFATFSGWVVVALFLLPCGLVFAVAAFRNGEPASARAIFQAAGWILIFVAPAIAMRTFSEELRLGTFETLATAPVGDGAIVLGKFLGAMGVLMAALAPTALLAVALELHGRPDYGELACGYAGLILAGGMYIASGVLASTFTRSQLVAFLGALFFWLIVSLCCRLLPSLAPLEAAEALYAADPLLRLRDFTIGLADSAHVGYFVLLAAVFLAGAVLSLRVRRCA